MYDEHLLLQIKSEHQANFSAPIFSMFLFIRDFYGYYSMYIRLSVIMLYIKLVVRVYNVPKLGVRSTRFDLDFAFDWSHGSSKS